MASKAFSEIQKEGMLLLKELSLAQGLGNQRKTLDAAQQLFQKLLSMSSNPLERAYSCQNLATVHTHWAKAELDACPSWTPIPKKRLAACKRHLAQSVGFYLKAMAEGARVGVQWKAMDMEACLLHVVNWAVMQSEAVGFPAAILLGNMCATFRGEQRRYMQNLRSHAAALAHFELVKSLFHAVRHGDAESHGERKEPQAWVEEWLQLLHAAEGMLPDRSGSRAQLESKLSALRIEIQTESFLIYLQLAKARLQQAKLNPKDSKSWPQCLHFLKSAESLLPCFKVLPSAHHDSITCLRRQVKIHRLKRCSLLFA